MYDKRNIINEIKEFKNKFDLNTVDTQKAEQLTEELYVNKEVPFDNKKIDDTITVSNKRNVMILISAFFIVFVVFITILVPIVLNNNSSNSFVYYDESQIETQIIDDIDKFVEDSSLSPRYYRGDTFLNSFQAGYVKDSGKLVYLQQKAIIFDTSTFDTIELSIVLSKDRFQIFDNFEKFANELIVGEVTVQYRTDTMGQTSNIYASFQDANVKYNLCLSIIAGLSIEDKLFYYISNII